MTPQALESLAHLRRARDLIDREYARPLDVPTMAGRALMSPAHFSRRFHAAYGETPYSYLMTRRIERAMALLRARVSVTDVHGGRLHIPRLVQLAVHRDRRGDPDGIPETRARRGQGHARLCRKGAHAPGPERIEQDRRSDEEDRDIDSPS